MMMLGILAVFLFIFDPIILPPRYFRQVEQSHCTIKKEKVKR